MSGLIGGLLRRRLEEMGGYELTALNRRPVEGIDTLQADISDLDAIRPAFEGKDLVVHLAALLLDASWERLRDVNVIGTYNVYEAARQAGVKRVVFASSGAAISAWEKVPPYDAIAAGRYDEVPESWPMVTHESVRPLALYGATKVWGEALGRHFAETYGLSIICVRIGAVHQDNRPREVRDYAVFLSHRDVVEALVKTMEAPEDVRYDVIFAVSRNRWGYRDLEHAREVVGYEPRDSAEDFR